VSTALFWDERFLDHDIGPAAGHIPASEYVEPGVPGEEPEAKRRIYSLLEASGLLNRLLELPGRAATRVELERFHSSAYIDFVRRLSEQGGGDAGDGALFSAGGYEIAALASGTCISAVESVLDGRATNAYALVRPPGHHAERDRGRGFCLFGNVALAAMHAREACGIARVAVVDWDVHHGNGTQQAFWEEPAVLTISIHQERNFPLDSGYASERGAGAGIGFNRNVPLPPGSGDAAYREAFERLVIPWVREFRPQLIVVACGVDAGALDPYGRMLLHSESFRWLARSVLRLAEKYCEGRIVLCHEGGYSAAYAPFCGLAILEELSGHRTPVADPFLAELSQCGGQDLQPHQAAAIAAAAG
jgi:acetoin utilization deacetylase AcuC-like enzyme